MVCTMFCPVEHQHLFPVAFTDHLRQQFSFAFLINKMNALFNLRRSGVTTRDFDRGRVGQQLARQTFNLIRERRGEQQVLTLGRQFCQQATDIVNEAHVQHAVGFVQHQNFNLR
ncbi:hypothetical protein SRABI106_03291 [Rahnella aquatilis]|nr:hypothetical protein SRABI106_03291 [Rahnella aquatilis]